MRTLLLLMLLALAAFGAYQLWQRGSEWWRAERAESVNGDGRAEGGIRGEDVERARAELDEKLAELAAPAPQASDSEILISERDLNNLLIASLADHPKGRRILELAREVGADIDDGRVEIHFVINLEDLPREELDERERETVEKLSRLLPLVADRDLRVAVSGVPAVREGRISVERDLRVKVGFLTLPVVDLGDALGISSERLRRRLEFGLEPLVVESVAVLDDALLLKIGTRAAA